MAQYTPSLGTAMRARTLIEQRMITLDEMDAWVYKAAEFVHAEQLRAMSGDEESDVPPMPVEAGTSLSMQGF